MTLTLPLMNPAIDSSYIHLNDVDIRDVVIMSGNMRLIVMHTHTLRGSLWGIRKKTYASRWNARVMWADVYKCPGDF